MQGVPIFFEDNRKNDEDDDFSCVSPIKYSQEEDRRWHPVHRDCLNHTDVPAEQWVDLFPEEYYGEYEADIREVEKRYNEDRIQFYTADIHDPELIPCAEQLQDTLAELMTVAKLIFDKIGKTPEIKMHALDVMDRIMKDCFALEDAVSRHAKLMMERYPDDEILRDDMTEIDSLFLDFYIDIYGTLGRYKKKGQVISPEED